MSEQKSLPSVCIACLVGAFVYWKGLVRGNKNGTDTWVEMLNVVKDGVFWIFMAIFTLLILAIIIYLFTVTFEKMRGLFVAWAKSENWCQKIETTFEENNTSMNRVLERCKQLENRNDYLTDKLEELYGLHFELKKLTGVDLKKAEFDAEREITGGA